VIASLLSLGADVVLVNRTLDKAQTLAARFGARVKPVSWAELPAALVRAGVLVNATSLGMKGQPALDVDLAPLPSHSTVVDIVYRPLETPLLARAEARV
jgi:shikimate dehydrogenase